MRKTSVLFFSFLGISWLLTTTLSWYMDRHPFLFCREKLTWVFNLRNTHHDVLAGGSSRVENNFNPLAFSETNGLHVLNMGYSGSTLSEIYATLHLFFKKGNSASWYFLQIDPGMVRKVNRRNNLENHPWFFVPFLNDSLIYGQMKDWVSRDRLILWKAFPFFKYAEFNSFYPLANYFFYQGLKKSPFDSSKGYAYNAEDRSEAFTGIDFYAEDKVELDSNQTEWVEKILQLCKSNGVEPLLYCAPYFNAYYESLGLEGFHQWMLLTSKKHQVKWLDFSRWSGNSNPDLFFNQIHLNKKGTVLFSRYFGEVFTSEREHHPVP